MFKRRSPVIVFLVLLLFLFSILAIGCGGEPSTETSQQDIQKIQDKQQDELDQEEEQLREENEEEEQALDEEQEEPESTASSAPVTTTPDQPQPTQTQSVEQEQPQEVVVYITNTGEKYHRGDCRYLKKSKIETTLSAAKSRGYTPCKVCQPPS